MIKFGPATVAAIGAAQQAINNLVKALEAEGADHEEARLIAVRCYAALLPLAHIEKVRGALAGIEAGRPLTTTEQVHLQQVQDYGAVAALGLDPAAFAATIDHLTQGS